LFSKICIFFYQQNASTFTIFNIPAVLCAYLGGDLKRLRASVLPGSIVPLLALLVWGAIALGLSDQAGHAIDPV
jgi:tyrosine-specific transport protein